MNKIITHKANGKTYQTIIYNIKQYTEAQKKHIIKHIKEHLKDSADYDYFESLSLEEQYEQKKEVYKIDFECGYCRKEGKKIDYTENKKILFGLLGEKKVRKIKCIDCGFVYDYEMYKHLIGIDLDLIEEMNKKIYESLKKRKNKQKKSESTPR